MADQEAVGSNQSHIRRKLKRISEFILIPKYVSSSEPEISESTENSSASYDVSCKFRSITWMDLCKQYNLNAFSAAHTGGFMIYALTIQPPYIVFSPKQHIFTQNSLYQYSNPGPSQIWPRHFCLTLCPGEQQGGTKHKTKLVIYLACT